MTALANAISRDTADHAALVRAHLLDEKFGPGSHLVQVEIETSLTAKDKPRGRSRGETAITYLSELRLTDRTANNLLIDLARALGAKI
jgi:hypothetical protein